MTASKEGGAPMFPAALYFCACSLLMASICKDGRKTMMALKKAWRSLDNILPQFLSIILIIGIMLAVLSPQDISRLIGKQSGWIGMMIAAIVGSVTLIPGFVAFPLAAALFKNGAGLMQIAVFVTTLMAVGIVTMPVEIKYFGRKVTVLRNALAFVFSFIVAILMGVILK
jgi:uncharacterized membrane protein YraQ (UPF0718 family)